MFRVYWAVFAVTYSLTDDPVEQVAVDSLYSQVHKSPVAPLVATTKLVLNLVCYCFSCVYTLLSFRA